MGMRFRRTISLAPGLRLNLGARGASLSAGPRGASITIGRNGVYGNVGMPGTGLSYRTRLDGRPNISSPPDDAENTVQPAPVTASISDDGRLLLTGPDGLPFPEDEHAAALKRNRPCLIDLLERRATELNEWSDRLIRPHLQTPTPMSFDDEFVPAPFELPRPEKPDPEEVSLISSWFGGRERADARYQEELASYRVAISQWRAAEENHGTDQEAARARHERWRDGDAIAAQELLEDRLGGISWPRETLISYQTTETELRVDVDLPEVEDMPAEIAGVLKREMRVEMRPKGNTERRLDYVTHVHSIAFRIAGEAFAAMPGLWNVLISGFSQRLSQATGRVEDEYLYSVRIDRSNWELINFSRRDEIDPSEAMSRFDLRRDMTRTGVFRTIYPF